MSPHKPIKTRLARTATTLTHVTAVAILALPIVYLALWFDPAVARREMAPSLPGIDQAGLPSWAVAGGFFLGIIPLMILLYGLWQVHRFFQLYRANDVFPAEAGRFLRNFGVALLVLVPVGVAMHTAASVLFSLHLPAGSRQLAVSISSNEIFVLLIGALVMMIGHILTEAHRLAEENRQIV